MSRLAVKGGPIIMAYIWLCCPFLLLLFLSHCAMYIQIKIAMSNQDN